MIDWLIVSTGNDREIDRQGDRQTDRQGDRQTDRQGDRQTQNIPSKALTQSVTYRWMVTSLTDDDVFRDVSVRVTGTPPGVNIVRLSAERPRLVNVLAY